MTWNLLAQRHVTLNPFTHSTMTHLQFDCFRVNISHIYAALVIEQNGVTLPVGINASVDFFLLLVGYERFNEKIAQLSSGGSNFDVLVHAFRDPLLHGVRVFVYRD